LWLAAARRPRRLASHTLQTTPTVIPRSHQPRTSTRHLKTRPTKTEPPKQHQHQPPPTQQGIWPKVDLSDSWSTDPAAKGRAFTAAIGEHPAFSSQRVGWGLGLGGCRGRSSEALPGGVAVLRRQTCLMA